MAPWLPAQTKEDAMVWNKPEENRMNDFEKYVGGIKEGRKAAFKQITVPIPAHADDFMLLMHVGQALIDLGRSFQVSASMTHQPAKETFNRLRYDCDDCNHAIKHHANIYEISLPRQRPRSLRHLKPDEGEPRVHKRPALSTAAKVIDFRGLLRR
jgi:hypothetical protein